MGEYAKRLSDGVEVKIGTSPMMYYLRYQDRDKVEQLPSSLDPQTQIDLYWRLPFPDEDHMQPGDYEPFKSSMLCKSTDYGVDQLRMPELAKNPGTIQAEAPDGLLLNVVCYHGEKDPEITGDVKNVTWNGKNTGYVLKYIKNTADGMKPVIGCKHCREEWICDWNDIWDYIQPALRERFAQYHTESKECV